MRKKPITPLGWAIRRRLAEMEMTQAEFCDKYQIPRSRLSEMVSGVYTGGVYFDRVLEILGIEDETKREKTRQNP